MTNYKIISVNLISGDVYEVRFLVSDAQGGILVEDNVQVRVVLNAGNPPAVFPDKARLKALVPNDQIYNELQTVIRTEIPKRV